MQSELMNQYQVMNRSLSNKTTSSEPLMNQSESWNQFQILDPVRQPALMVSQGQTFPQFSMFSQSNLIPHSYGNLTHQPHGMPPMNNLKFPKQRNPNFGGVKQGRSSSKWKGKKAADDRKKAVGKRKLERMGPYSHAPRNTTSYLIRAKKEGGIASLVSPFPVTPAVLPSPVFSPARETLVDMAKEEWGVDGYGSMKGLIRLRSSPGLDADVELELDDYQDEDDDRSCESDVEEHFEVERRLEQDLSRFEMVYPNPLLGNRVDDQDTQILQLEDENLFLRGRLYLLERELGDIKRRMHCLERHPNLDAAALQGQEEEEDVHIHQELMFQNVSEAAEENGIL